MLLTIIIFILVLSVLVFVHELGHFMMARRFGVKAEEFGFGFPPRIFGIYKNTSGQWKQVWGGKEVSDCPKTVYSINLIPLGGFVKIKGENGENQDEQDSFAGKKVWRRALMLAAGVLMNVLLAMFLITTGFMIGLPQVLEGVDNRAIVTDQKIQVVQVFDNSPAAIAGVKMGDIIASVNGRVFINYADLQRYVAMNTGKKLAYNLKRGGSDVTIKVTPELRTDTGKGGIGIAITETGLVRFPWFLAIWQGIKTTVNLIWVIITAFFQLIKGLIMGQGVSGELAGPVGIAVVTGQVARMGFIYLLQFIALLSVNLAVINFLPFPALDGGRVLFLIIEKLKGSPVKREIENVIHNIGFTLLMILVLVVTFRDVARFGDVFKEILSKIF